MLSPTAEFILSSAAVLLALVLAYTAYTRLPQR